MNPRKEPAIKLALGDRVKDRITGFEGIVTSITDFLAGCRRVAVTPQTLHDGKPIEADLFDEPDLIVQEKSVLSVSEESKKRYNIKLGDRVQCEITGFTGIVTSATSYLSSQSYFGVTSETLVDGKPVSPHSFSGSHLKKLRAQKEKEPTGRPSGGNQKIPRRAF